MHQNLHRPALQTFLNATGIRIFQFHVGFESRFDYSCNLLSVLLLRSVLALKLDFMLSLCWIYRLVAQLSKSPSLIACAVQAVSSHRLPRAVLKIF
jgi:hypothetical protein